MHKTIIEDWEFDIEVLSAKPCRMGFEPGDRFHCMYEVPAGFCPKNHGCSSQLMRGGKIRRRLYASWWR